MKYLEKGHTFMHADVIHGQIGKLMKKAKTIATFDDFVEIVDKSGRKVKPIFMDDRSFYDIDKKNRSKSTKKVTMPLLEDIVQVEFRKGHRAFIQEQLIQCDFLINKFSVQNEKLKVRGRHRGIPEKKEMAF